MATKTSNKRVSALSLTGIALFADIAPLFFVYLANCVQLVKEYQAIQKSPTPYITAHPSEENILLWYYLIEGPPDTPYFGGQYMGTLKFPPEYPFKPPAVTMITPSGRFQTNTRLCFSFSDFHPKEWNPSWQVSTILVGLLSFMTSDANTAGSMVATSAERVLYAQKSKKWNSAQNYKFPIEFPAEHAANLEWIKKTEEEEAARRRVEEELRARGELPSGRNVRQEAGKRGSDGRGKWIVIGVVGVLVAMRAWQRFNDGATA